MEGEIEIGAWLLGVRGKDGDVERVVLGCLAYVDGFTSRAKTHIPSNDANASDRGQWVACHVGSCSYWVRSLRGGLL